MRLFTALPIPPDTVRALVKAQDDLRQFSKGGRYVPADNFHVTLNFIGESENAYAAALALDEASRGIKPILLRLAGYSSFPRGESKTVYINLEGNLDELRRLYETLTAALIKMGFSFSGGNKRYTPHITLARDVFYQGKIPRGLYLNEAGLGSGVAFSANRLILYESINIKGKLIYNPIHSVTLG